MKYREKIKSFKLSDHENYEFWYIKHAIEVAVIFVDPAHQLLRRQINTDAAETYV